MWCRQCKQDVPAARLGGGPRACARCHSAFDDSSLTPSNGQPADCGLSLEAFDRPAVEPSLLSNVLAMGGADEQIRQIGRLLRPSPRSELLVGQALARFDAPHLSPPPDDVDRRIHRAAADLAPREPAVDATIGSGVSALLSMGGAAFAAGAVCLAASAALAQPVAWKWGMTATMIGEGLLIAGLAALAVRLWSNGRRVSSQVGIVDQRVGDLHQVAEQLAAGRLTASQSYYEHFGTTASPPLALAQLRGQVDSLAARWTG